MRQHILRVLCAPLALAALYWFFEAQAWGITRLLAVVVLTAAVSVLISGLGGFFAVTCLLAANASDLSGEPGFFDGLFALYSVLASGCLLACVVLRHPSLGEQIEHDLGGI